MVSNIFVDLETTGLSSKKDDIIEFAGIKVQKGEVIGSLHQFIRPKAPMNLGAQAAHGLSVEFLSEFPLWEEVKEKIDDFLGNGHIFAYNAPFDTRFLAKNGISMDRPIMDLLKRARATLGKRTRNHKLGTVCQYYNIEADFHSALGDCQAMLELCRIWRVI